jgi:hypothetical protein
MKGTYFTNFRFKLPAECPTKLFYNVKLQLYQTLQQEDSFLTMLADAGYQIDELAKSFYFQAQTLEWLKQDKAVV